MQISFQVLLEPATAFDAVLDELQLSLDQMGMALERGPGGQAPENGARAARICTWNPPHEVILEWAGESWQNARATRLALRFEAAEGGTRVVLEQDGPGPLPGDDAREAAAWMAAQILAPAIAAASPERAGDWLTDRRARRPSGPQARDTYRNPLYHRPNFLANLDVLRLGSKDDLVEIGCGGGAFLHDALESGCRAAAIDHSADMVRTARELNRESIAAGRLEIRQGDAASLPFPSGRFTCAVMTGVFGFLQDPVAALSEIVRVLAPAGQLVLYTGSGALRGTPAAPEPIASRLHFYEDEELEKLALRAGFSSARVEHPDFEGYAREAGVPDDAIPLFRDRESGQLLVAHK